MMTVKGNMPALHRQLKKLPWKAVPSVSFVATGHGHRAHRAIKVALAPSWIGFAGNKLHWVATSPPAADPKTASDCMNTTLPCPWLSRTADPIRDMCR
jgi:hypothetical protein